MKYLTLPFKKFVFTFLFFYTTFLNAQTAPNVIGYFPDFRMYAVNQVDFTKLTHVNFSFGNPDASGNLVVADIAPLKQAISNSNPNIKILLSIAGGVVNVTNWNSILSTSTSRASFINKLVNYTITNNIAGIDVDLEWDFANNVNYSPFVLELKAALQANNKLMTAALPGETQFSVISQAALDAFDFINIMAYDYTGPWQPSNPGQHSSYQNAQNAINFWKARVAANKLNLGVPFYSHTFINSTTAGTSRTFGEIVTANVLNADVDQIGNNLNNYNEYYNGRPTIRDKVRLSKTQGIGGIMIWELGQDSFTQYSLLKAISDEYLTLSDSNFDLKAFSVYPNPVKDILTIYNQNNKKIESLEVFDVFGKKIGCESVVEEGKTTINLSNFSNGVYVVKIRHEGGLTAIKALKS